jgi:hypothetical protein
LSAAKLQSTTIKWWINKADQMDLECVWYMLTHSLLSISAIFAGLSLRRRHVLHPELLSINCKQPTHRTSWVFANSLESS